MGDIFLSYSRDDQDAVAELVAALERAGFSIWWDGEIPPGEDFRSFIDRKLNEAPAICVVWSANSVNSRWVHEEAEEGVRRLNLVPIAIDETDLPRGFRAFQCARLLPSLSPDKYDAEFQKLVQRLRELNGSAERPQSARPKRRAPTRRSPLAFKSARIQNLSMLVAFTAVAGAFAFYDFIVDPGNLRSLWFRLGVMLPSLFLITGAYFLARAPWQTWLLAVAATWLAVVLGFYQVGNLNQPEFQADGYGTTLTMVLVLVLSGAGLVHDHSSRAVALFGGIVVYACLAYLGGAEGVAFWATIIANLTAIALFLCLGFYLRDQRVR